MATIAFENLTLGYDRHPAVHHLDTTLDSGSLTALVGPNGAGKSTLLKGVAGALRPLGGRIDLVGSDHDSVAYLPQQAEIDKGFPVRLFDLVAMGLWRRIGMLGPLSRPLVGRVEEVVALVGLEGLERRAIGSLSGGQLQRALFARLILQDATIILLDEPLSGVDAATSQALLQLMLRWHGEARTVIAALHDLEAVRRHFPDTLMIARTLVAHGPTREVLTTPNVERARQRCEAFDDEACVCCEPAQRRAA